MQINSLVELSRILETSYSHIQFIINNKEECYYTYPLAKKSGTRVISKPNNSLKKIQRSILKKILYTRRVHTKSSGFVKGRNTRYHCKYHVGNRIIYNLDLKDFFPSINPGRVYGIFNQFRFDKDVTYVLKELCTFNKQLPQGAPTSPYMANLICKKLDMRLSGLAKKFSLNYSRYADDLTFSGERVSKKVSNYIKQIIKEEGFKIAKNKERIVTSKGSQKITGLIVNSKISIGRKNYLKLRSTIVNCLNKGAAAENRINHPNYKKHLYGKVAFLKSIDEEKARKLKLMLDSIDWNATSHPIKSWKHFRLITEIIEIFNSINDVVSTKIFRDNNKNIAEILKPVNSREDFNARIQSLSKIFDEIDPSFFVSNLSEEQLTENNGEKKRSRRLIQAYTELKNRPNAKINKSLIHIINLGKGIYRHNVEENLIRSAFVYYRQNPKNTDYGKFWHDLLADLLTSLRHLYEMI